MRSGQNRTQEPDIEIAKASGADALLADMLAGGFGKISHLLEALYYAREDDLMAIMRLIATLEPDDRARTYDFANAICCEEGPSGSL
jgi:hypothetical protein